MTLEQIQKDMIIAMKEGDKFRKGVLAELVGAVKKAGIDAGHRDNIPENIVDSVLTKEKKTANEMVDTCPEDRPDTLIEYMNRVAIIEQYAPRLLDEPEEIEDIISGILATNQLEATKSNRGNIMKALSQNFKGKIDMKVAAKVLSDMLK